ESCGPSVIRDSNCLMESRSSPAQFRVLNHISRIAAEQALNLYLAGGAVRDLTFGQRTVRDLDFVVGGNPQKVLPHLVPATKRRAKAGQRRINLSRSEERRVGKECSVG